MSVCVIIAAKDASLTIARAVTSALDQAEVARVIVVDDGSSDDTGESARRADDGSGRLTVIHHEVNRGPSHARNAALALVSEPYVAILDADDIFLPGRFTPLFRHSDWDAIADNIAFVSSPDTLVESGAEDGPPRTISLVDFVRGNLTTRGAPRRELGFLKPVMRLAFLKERGLGYSQAMRLGEDYDLYARMLAHGARFMVVPRCGYCAVVRGESLSAWHTTSDLERLAAADLDLLAMTSVPSETKAALLAHYRQISDRIAVRRFLDAKRERGLLAAAAQLSREPRWVRAAATIIADKLTPARPAVEQGSVRYLLSDSRRSAG
jgi:succinoglycan biosynthesis protein ExoU